jgi:hypothetical protein
MAHTECCVVAAVCVVSFLVLLSSTSDTLQICRPTVVCLAVCVCVFVVASCLSSPLPFPASITLGHPLIFCFVRLSMLNMCFVVFVMVETAWCLHVRPHGVSLHVRLSCALVLSSLLLWIWSGFFSSFFLLLVSVFQELSCASYLRPTSSTEEPGNKRDREERGREREREIERHSHHIQEQTNRCRTQQSTSAKKKGASAQTREGARATRWKS